MAYYEIDEICDAYKEACDEADVWRENYPEYERLMDNGLMEGLDENLPEVNDGSLAASLFKLAKRAIRKNIGGRAKSLDREDAYITEFANILWENRIIKQAKTQGTPRAKLKDAVRKAAGYGSQPVITFMADHGADFIVPYAQDVKLEAGKMSDLDSDIIFWDVYYSKVQLRALIEQAEAENAEDTTDGFNKWNVEALQKILDSGQEEDRPGNEEHNEKSDKGVKKSGYHFFIAFQRGVDAPFYMFHKQFKKEPVREWSNPDPTGDMPVHYLYFYQDFINPYGIGVVKLAGGTQNVLDYMRQADILATQLGLRPPKRIQGDINDVDFDSLIYAQDADWIVGNANVERMEISNQVYQQLPERISMYQTSLQKVIPMGDTTISGSDSGDPSYSKTPAGIKMAAANLSIDDEDIAENVDELYARIAKSMINIEFANMQGEDLLRLSAEERDLLMQAGIEFPVGPDGQPTSELDFSWDDVRATFDFEVDPESDKVTDEQTQLEGLKTITAFLADPTIQQLAMSGGPMILGSKKVDIGELVGEIVHLSTENDKIVSDVSPEKKASLIQQQAQPMAQPNIKQPIPEQTMPIKAPIKQPVEGEVIEQPQDPDRAEFEANLSAVMEEYNISAEEAAAMLEAERDGFSPEEILAALERNRSQEVVNA